MGDNILAVRDFSDVFQEELLGMPSNREVEFAIDLLPETTPTPKQVIQDVYRRVKRT